MSRKLPCRGGSILLGIKNRSPLEAALIPWVGADGHEAAVLIVKGTFDIRDAGGPLRLSETQVPIHRSDSYRGDAAASSLTAASESCSTKSGTDVVLLGHACSMTGPVKVLDVELRVGTLRKVVRAFGDRVWFKLLGTWQMSNPVPFERMPLIYERAFGGMDSAANVQDRRNPVGTGFAARRSDGRLDGLALPNLEDPQNLIRQWDSRPAPVGFGFIAPQWEPRCGYAGTYDQLWRQERFPLLPQDFDERFYNAASQGLIARPHLRGGESVQVLGASRGGPLAFALPGLRPDISVKLRGRRAQHAPVLDTVVINTDERWVTLSWKVTVPCPRAFLYLEEVAVSCRTGGN
ncbi:DUF2169 family type VI secretion system accessory protein [Pyxidicoccus caerfyrddinensis]|uniref:DUF2169 family type VI secretion system accessory protein n=1 Tax=Pyxidicoccus caerfyrddinensis TaxID=2709663 RepID=UPI0013DB6A50|nr:DUF2169 domain-containing protein [Pyxidicoccus caerfyrddinensis]